ncbi:hypothetical protein KAT51_04100 [bacterium]|nr:hypothetical protein [bacterium]
MSEKEEEVVGANPRCYRCGREVEFGKASILLTRGGFFILHMACHAKFIDNYRIQKGSVPLEGTVN